MKSHQSEGLHFPRERRFVDHRNGRLRAVLLQIVGIVGGSLLSAILIALVIRL